jgi:hypothetical protein
MSDERLRELTRRWELTGATDDGAALLQARVRAGQLTPAQLELLAYSEDLAARELVSSEPTQASVEAWIKGLLRFKALGSRAACVAALCATQLRRAVETERSLHARAGAVAWIDCPCKEHEAEVVRLKGGVSYDIPDLSSGTVSVIYAVMHAARRARRDCVDQACLVVHMTISERDPSRSESAIRTAVLGGVRRWILQGALVLEG